MANIKQTDLLEFIVNQFNSNSFGIPYRMGTYEGDASNGLVIYAPPMSNDGFFDKTAQFDEETYQTTEKSFVAMQAQMSNGDYVALPDTSLVTYSVSVSFLVNIDNPISEIIRMSIEEVRDRLIGRINTLAINEVDLDNENGAVLEDMLKIVTNASGIDFGQIIEIKGRRYLEYSLTVNMTISKDVEFGNQFEWQISFNQLSFVFLGTNLGISYVANINQTNLSEPDLLQIDISQYQNNEVIRVETYDGEESVFYYYRVTYNYETVIPLIASFGVNQELESFQNLNSFTPIQLDKAKEIHSYVKMRGFSHTFTFLFKRNQNIIKQLFTESFKKLSVPNEYRILMRFKYLDTITNEFTYDDDISWERALVIGEAVPSDIVLGTPIMFTVGFHPSAKEE